MNVQRIYAIRNQVEKAAKAYRLPAGWEEVIIAAPREMIAELRERIAAIRAVADIKGDTDTR